VNARGPFHAYVELPTVLAERESVVPEQTGALKLAVGAAGDGFTTTEVVPVPLGGHPGTVAFTE
jgi:hypothetical protein